MSTLRMVGQLGWCLWSTLAWAGDGPGDVMPTRHWDVEHLHLDVRVDPAAGTVAGSTTHTVTPLGRRHLWLRLHQIDLDVTAVSVDGAPADHRLGPDTLDVRMPSTGERHEVVVTYTATPRLGMHFRRPDPVLEAWTQGEDEDHRYWFPSWDHPSDRFTLSTRIEAPSGLHAVSNGAFMGSEPVGDGWTAWSYQLDQRLVNYLVAVAVGEYTVVTDDRARVPFEYIVPTGTNVDAAVDLLDEAVDNFAWLETLLGTPYPYPAYRQILASRFLYGGMENTTATLIDLSVVPQNEQDPTSSWGRTVVSHELTHQWFGDLLTCYGWREMWLNEGFAQYYEERWMEHTDGPQLAALRAVKTRSAALRSEHAMAPNGWTFAGRDHAAVYVRGAATLRMLERHLGRDVFDAGIQLYVARNADRLVETSDLRRALEDVSGQHLGWLFDRIVHTPAMPAAKSRWSHEDGVVTVTLAPVVEEDTVPAHLPVLVEVGLPGGTRTQTLWLGDEATSWVLDSEEPPLWVAVDADVAAVVDWEHKQTTAQWTAQLTESEHWTARVVALQQLRDVEDVSEEAVAAVIALLDDPETHEAIAREAARTLGHLSTPAAIDRLIAGAEDPRRRVQEACIDALAEVPPEAPVLDHLLDLEKRSDDALLRASALQVLGALDAELALPLARKRLRRDDPTSSGVEHRSALQLLGAHGDAKDVRTLIRALDAANPEGVRSAAIWGLRDRARSLDDVDNWRSEASDALVALLDDLDADVRSSAIWALGSVGDADAEATLRAWARTWPTPEADSARDAAAAIRKRLRAAGSPVEPGRLRNQSPAWRQSLSMMVIVTFTRLSIHF